MHCHASNQEKFPQQSLQLPLRLSLTEIRRQLFYLFNSEGNNLVDFATFTLVVPKTDSPKSDPFFKNYHNSFCIRPKSDTLLKISASVSFWTTIVESKF